VLIQSKNYVFNDNSILYIVQLEILPPVIGNNVTSPLSLADRVTGWKDRFLLQNFGNGISRG